MKKFFMLGWLIGITGIAPACAQTGGDTTSGGGPGSCSIIFFNANPATVNSGGSATLNWATTNCTNVTIMGGTLSGYQELSGSINSGALSATTTFTLTAASPTSTATRKLVLPVQIPAPPQTVTTTTTTGAVRPPIVEPPASTTTTTIVTQPSTPPPPATTTTTITSNTAATPVYNIDNRRSIDVNRLRFGAYLAPTISWMKPTASTDDEKVFNVSNNGSKIGFTYGLMADYFFAENYGIATGIQINQTGGKILATNRTPRAANLDERVVKAEFDYRLQYLEIPLALKLRTDEFNGFRFFGQLGVTAGFNIGKKADYDVEYFRSGATVANDTSGTKIKLTGSLGHIAPLMFQMNIGAGAEYPISNKLSFYIGLFFNNGFAPDATKPNLFEEDKLGYRGEFRDASTRLNNFALRLGLFF